MTVLHTGATKKYTDGWMAVFGKSSGAKTGKAKSSASGKKASMSAKKPSGKKVATRSRKAAKK